MLTKLNIKVNQTELELATRAIDYSWFKISFNKPTKSFFYDPWVIKEEFKNTVWDKLLSYLPMDIGEARLILLQPGNCYNSHSDIDDRYHLNIVGNYSFLVNIDDATMYKTVADCYWYEMDAGPRHSAVNYGEVVRAQLVVRKLLKSNALEHPISLAISPNDIPIDDARYIFDDTVSIWLNRAVKNGIVMNFNYNPTSGEVSFDVEYKFVNDVLNLIPPTFKVIHGYK